MGNTRNVGKRESMVRSVLGSILVVLSFFLSAIFWLGVGVIGVIVALSGFMKY